MRFLNQVFLSFSSSAKVLGSSCPKSLYKVFVYGTLKRKEPNHHWLQNRFNGSGELYCEARTCVKYPLIIGTKYNIPFLLYKPGVGHFVKGEVWEVDNKMLKSLDLLEGHPHCYERKIESIMPIESEEARKRKLQFKREIRCWVYFMKSFKEALLKAPTMESYSSLGPHGRVYAEKDSSSTYCNTIDEINKFIR